MDNFSFGDLIKLAKQGSGSNFQNHAEFLALVETAQVLKEMQMAGR
jgi:hypothetical protein